ncbi:MAG TPA: transglycosylase SLT domain-containing protein, partial [Thermoanaerobaculia bacterium]|nr:transglycosylase SLT domain-containing protein [Thermoanaerobaculia bacterium]
KLVAFVDRLASEVSDQLRRALQAEKVSALFGTGSRDQALDLGFRLLGEDVADDAAERAMNEILDAAGEVALSGEQLSLLAQTAHAHRHFRRAVDLLQKARENLPGYSERLHFLTARAWFWAEDYAKAEEEYVAAAGRARANQDKAELYHHAGRAAQLRGDLARAEEHFTRAIAVRGNFRATAASLIQRMRIRLEDQRYQAGLGDLRLLFRLFPRSGWVVDGAMSYVVSMVGAERSSEALRILPQIPEPALDDFDRAEMNYWTGRALESRAPLDALDHYLDVLNADVPTHYRHFVRARLRTPALAAETRKAIQRRRSAVRATMAAREWDQARRLQTEIVRLTANEDDGDLELLRKIYTEIPDYALAAEATPLRFPAFPTETEGESAFGRGGPKADGQDAEEERGRLLMAMGLYEEAAQAIPRIYPGNRMRGGLTRALALREAGELDLAVRAAEEVEENLPDDFVPELQPEMLRKLLYPEYFYPEIVEQSRTHQADPRLVLSIMREESRFDPRAKSPAGARGLLQFVILTAREIGLEIGLESISSEQLYDPGTIIGLGARYVGNLMKRFEQNRYATAAAYNAGPQQAELWRRLAAGEGDDFLFAAINFDETRNYVQKVMNSDFAYRKIYGE